MQNDLYNDIDVRRAISPVSVADNTAAVSQIIDTKGYSHCAFLIATGSIADADATFAVLVEDGDNSSLTDNGAVPDDNLIGTEAGASFQFDDDNEVRKIAYKPRKRYVRLTITPTGNASAALLSAVAVLSGSTYKPV